MGEGEKIDSTMARDDWRDSSSLIKRLGSEAEEAKQNAAKHLPASPSIAKHPPKQSPSKTAEKLCSASYFKQPAGGYVHLLATGGTSVLRG